MIIEVSRINSKFLVIQTLGNQILFADKQNPSTVQIKLVPLHSSHRFCTNTQRQFCTRYIYTHIRQYVYIHTRNSSHYNIPCFHCHVKLPFHEWILPFRPANFVCLTSRPHFYPTPTIHYTVYQSLFNLALKWRVNRAKINKRIFQFIFYIADIFMKNKNSRVIHIKCNTYTLIPAYKRNKYIKSFFMDFFFFF